MEKYKPNFGDKRCQDKYWHSINWAIRFFRNRARKVSSRYLDQKIGYIHNPMTKYLRYYLLECVDSHYSPVKSKAKRYRLRISGINYLKARLEGTYTGLYKDFILLEQADQTDYVNQKIDDYWKDVVKRHSSKIRSIRVEYKHYGGRFYNEVQNIPRDIRTQLLAQEGISYRYDIQCCAPTLLLQNARQLGLTHPTPVLDSLIEDRRRFRREISELCGITEEQVKLLVNAILQGGKINANMESEVYTDILKCDDSAVFRLNRSIIIIQLKKEIKLMWDVLKLDIPRHRVQYMRKGILRERWSTITATKKARRYQELESQVTKAVMKYLKIRHIGNICIHDGWVSTRSIDTDQLTRHIYKETKFIVKVEYEGRANTSL